MCVPGDLNSSAAAHGHYGADHAHCAPGVAGATSAPVPPTVRVLDWDATIPMSRSIRRDPRMPLLSKSRGFVEGIAQGWDDRLAHKLRTVDIAPEAAQAAARHREKLSHQLPGKTLVIAAGRSQLRVGDTFFDFRAHSDFLWATGVNVEDAVLVMRPAAGGHEATLYIVPPARPGDADFYGNALHGELWVGPIPGIEEYSEALGLRAAPLASLSVDSDALIAGSPVVGPAAHALEGKPQSAELARVLSELRIYKDEWEITELRRAISETAEGFAQVRREIPAAVGGGGERWLQGTFDRYARTVGNGPGYASIVGSGAHAPILHWVRADGAVSDSELLLLDMGIEVRSGYTADVTRTLPASGRFSTVQREVHDVVEEAHRAGLAAVKPGRPWADFHAACMEVLARRLHDWGLLPVSVDEALSPDGQQHRRYIVCGVGHHVGLDVHDCESSRYEKYLGGTIGEDMVLTVEPGLYFHSWDTTIPPELRGIGVRIEDDVLVTSRGIEVLSDQIPIDAAGIERWMDEVM